MKEETKILLSKKKVQIVSSKQSEANKKMAKLKKKFNVKQSEPGALISKSNSSKKRIAIMGLV